MHNTLARAQNAFGFFTSCAFTLAFIIAVLSVVPITGPSASPSASISSRNVQVVKGRPHYDSTTREEYAHIRFDLNADLSPLFTWNTKQLFVYVTANYPSGPVGGPSAGESEAVIWDIIIPAPESPYSWNNLKAQYWPETMNRYQRKKTSTRSNTKTKEISKPGVLNLKNQKPKYQITDPTGLMGERSNVTLQVGWNVQPWVGALIWNDSFLGRRVGAWKAGRVGRSQRFALPAIKSKTSETVKEGSPQTPAAGSAKPAVNV